MLAEVDAHPHPAKLAGVLSMPKPTVTMYLKRLEAAGLPGAVELSAAVAARDTA